MGAFTIDVVVGVHGDQTEFAAPFLSPCLRVDDQVFDAIAPHTPLSTVQVSDPVTTLLNRRFGYALDSCTKAKRVVVPVRWCNSRLTIKVPGRKGPRPAGCISDTANGGENQCSRESIVRQPFASLEFRGE